MNNKFKIDIYYYNKCYTYKYKYIDFFIPPIEILDNLCDKDDKTYLFIISLMRIIVLIIITTIYYYLIGIKGMSVYIYCLLLIYIFINTVILITIIFKRQEKSTNLIQDPNI